MSFLKRALQGVTGERMPTSRPAHGAAGTRNLSMNDEDLPTPSFHRNLTMPEISRFRNSANSRAPPPRGSICMPANQRDAAPPLAGKGLVPADDYGFDIGENGRVLSKAEKRDYVKKNGLCPHCGRISTHKKSIVGSPAPRTNNKVYKGYCLDCYRKEDVMKFLGEIPGDNGSSSKPSPQASRDRASLLIGRGGKSSGGGDADDSTKPKTNVDATSESGSVEGATGGQTAATSKSPSLDPAPTSLPRHNDGSRSPVRFRPQPENTSPVDVDTGVLDENNDNDNNVPPEDGFREGPPPMRFVHTQPSESSVSTLGIESSFRISTSLSRTMHSSSKEDEDDVPHESEIVFDPSNDDNRGNTDTQLQKPVYRRTSIGAGSDTLRPPPSVRSSSGANSESTRPSPSVPENEIDVEAIVKQMQIDGRNNDHRAVTTALRHHGSKPAVVIEGCKVLCDRAVTLLREHQDEVEEAANPQRPSNNTQRRAREKQGVTNSVAAEPDEQDDGWNRRNTQQRRQAKMEQSRPQLSSSGTPTAKSDASDGACKGNDRYQPVTVVNPAAFLPEAWAKCLTTLSKDNRGNVPVVEEITKTIGVLVSLDHRYKTHITGAEGVEGILENMAYPKHKDCWTIQTNSFGILTSLSSSLLHAKSVLKRGKTAVSVLMGAIDALSLSSSENMVDTCHPVEAALRTLHAMVLAESGLASQSRGDTDSIAVQICNYKGEDGGIRCLLNTMKAYPDEGRVEEWTIRLLTSVLKSLKESDNGDVLSHGLLVEMGELLVRLLSRQDPQMALTEDVSALLLVLIPLLSVFESSDSILPFSEVTRREKGFLSMIGAIVETMKTAEASDVLLWNSCQILSMLCRIETRSSRAKAAANAGAIEVLVKVLGPNHTETKDGVVSAACTALASLCAGVDSNKQLVADADGIAGLVRALQRRWGANYDPKSNLVDSACLALSTLGTHQGLSSAFLDMGVLGELVKEWSSGDDENEVVDVSASRLGAVADVLTLVGHEVTSTSQQESIARFSCSCLRKADDVSVDDAFKAVSILSGLSSSVTCEAAVAASAIDAMMEVDGLSECAGGLMLSERFQSEESLQVVCCQLLHNIFVAQKDGVRSSWGSSDRSVEAICSVMAANRRSTNLQLAAMQALEGLCTSLPPEYIAAHLAAPLMTAVGQVSLSMRAFPDSETVQIASCDFLWAVSRVDQSLAVLVAESNVLDCVVEAMENFRENKDVALPACGAIAVVSSVPANVIKVGTPEIIDCVHDSCLTFGDHVEIVEKCFITISNLSADTYQVKLEVLRTEGIIGTILASMYQHQTSSSIQYSCCATLAYIAIENEVKQLVGSSGGIGAIIGAMSEHGDDAGVQEKACEALCNLISGVPNEILTGNETVRRVVETMNHEKHKGNAIIQEKAISAIWNLSVKDVHNKVYIADAGGVDCIVGAMGMHLDDETIQERGSVALWSLCIDVRNQLVVGRAGGVEATLNAMKAHSCSAPIQEQCLGALKVLATNTDNKKRIVDNNGVDAIVATLRAHVMNSDIQQAGCAALSNISVYHGSNLAAPMSEDVLDVAMDAMRNHHGVGTVMEAVCRLLRNYSFNQDNVELMRSRSEELFAMLLTAAEDFPGRCQDRANDIMNVCLTEVVKSED